MRHGRLGRLLGWASSQLAPRLPRWRCRSSSWPTSCTGPAPARPHLHQLGSRPCGGLCASHHVQEQNAEQQCSLVYFKMLQLNESLFQKVSHFSYKNTVLLIQLKSSNGFSCRRNSQHPQET